MDDALKQRERDQHPEIGRQPNGAALRHQHDDAADRNADNDREDDKYPIDAHAWLAAVLPSAACAAASRAIGTRNGEHET